MVLGKERSSTSDESDTPGVGAPPRFLSVYQSANQDFLAPNLPRVHRMSFTWNVAASKLSVQDGTTGGGHGNCFGRIENSRQVLLGSKHAFYRGTLLAEPQKLGGAYEHPGLTSRMEYVRATARVILFKLSVFVTPTHLV